MKATAIAHPNIALIKYWGKLNRKLNLPANSSLALTIQPLHTITTVEFSNNFSDYIIETEFKDSYAISRIISHLELIKKVALDKGLKVPKYAKVKSYNNFPMGTGLASSASGYAALTEAATSALGLNLTPKEKSIIASYGSGSASRSIFGGYVIRRRGESHSEQLVDENYFIINDFIVIVDRERKKIGSSKGMVLSRNSPLYKARLDASEKNFLKMRRAIIEKDFDTMGSLAEEDCFLMHAIMITTKPPLLYWSPSTLKIIKEVIKWREEGLRVYFTIDAGPNVHILCLPKDSNKVEKKLKELEEVKEIIKAYPGSGSRLLEEHLF
ncbi:Homoserine kinase [archaeon HR06]|nr:Homoserine kinase [archaeon HR06]